MTGSLWSAIGFNLPSRPQGARSTNPTQYRVILRCQDEALPEEWIALEILVQYCQSWQHWTIGVACSEEVPTHHILYVKVLLDNISKFRAATLEYPLLYSNLKYPIITGLLLQVEITMLWKPLHSFGNHVAYLDEVPPHQILYVKILLRRISKYCQLLDTLYCADC